MPVNSFNLLSPSNTPGNISTTTNSSHIMMSPKSVDSVDGTMSYDGNSNATTCLVGSTNCNMTNLSTMIPERDTNGHSMNANMKIKSMNTKSIPHRPIAGPAKLTIQSIPVKSQPPMLSSNLSNQRKLMHANLNEVPMMNGIINAHNRNNNNNHNNNHNQNNINGSSNHNNSNNNNKNNNNISNNQSNNGVDNNGNRNESNHYVVKSSPVAQNAENPQNLLNQQKNTIIMRTHHHGSTKELVRNLQRVQECHSSSDENRSSGHASMSDTGHGSSSPGCGKYYVYL